MAHTSSFSTSPISPARTSGGGWFSRISGVAEAMAAVVPPRPGDEPKSLSKPKAEEEVEAERKAEQDAATRAAIAREEERKREN
jgi:hypothetical protein